MSRLFLVRHGQASFMDAHYDRLSDQGRSQCLRLGRWFQQHKFAPDAVLVGPLQRHRQSWDCIREGWFGFPLDDGAVLEEASLEEYPAHVVMAQLLPDLAAEDPEVSAWIAAWQAKDPSARKNFQRVFEKVINRWVSGEVVVEGVASWQKFSDKVMELLPLLRDFGEGRTILAVSSGGPMSVLVGHALDLSPAKTIEVSWAIRNSAWCEFKYNAERFSLDAFNVHSHLVEQDITYR